MMSPAAASTRLPAPPDGSDRFSILVYAHTHWDREWYQPFERFRVMLVHAVDRVLDTLELEPAFTTFVLDGQTIVLDDYLEIRPEARPRIERLVKAGRLEVGPWYILPDEFLVSGESLVRNLLEGRRGARTFGSELAVGYLPDPFGHVAQLPAVLAGFGINSVVFSRGMGNEYATLGPVFRWLGSDLTTGVTAVVQTATRTNGYCNAELLSKVRDISDSRRVGPALDVAVELADHLAGEANTNTLVFAAGCDHETINPQLPQLLGQLADRVDRADISISGLAGIIDSIESSVARRALRGDTLAEHAGELRGSFHAPILAAIFSARIALKQDNVRLQTRLERCIEPLVALASAAGVWRSDGAILRHAWKLALQNQPHDSIGGCSVDATHLDMPPRTRAAHEVCDGLVEDLLAALDHHETEMVFNPAGVTAGGIVDRVVWGGTGHADVSSVTGNADRAATDNVTAALDHHSTDTFTDVVWAADMPALSLVPVEDIVGRAASASSARTSGSRSIETDTLRVAVGDDDKVSVVLSVDGDPAAATRFTDVLQFVDVADAGDEYDFAPLAGDIELRAALVGVEATMAGPGVAQLALTHELALPLGLRDDRRARVGETRVHRIETVLRVAGDLPFVQCVTRFTNEACDHRLRVRVALDGRATHTLGDGHFAMTERPIALPVPASGWKQDPVPSQHCESAAVLPAADGLRGVAVFTRGLHEYEAVGLRHDSAVHDSAAGADEHALDVTLVRSIGWLSRNDIPGRPGHAGPALATPDAQCLGDCAVEFAIAPFCGTWEDAAIATNARRFSSPPVLLPTIPHERRRHSGQQSREIDIAVEVAALHAGSPAVFPTGGIELTGIELSTVKPADDGSGDVIVRGFNAGRQPVEAELTVRLPCTKIVRCQLDELPSAGESSTRSQLTAGEGRGAASLPAGARARARAGQILSWRITPAAH